MPMLRHSCKWIQNTEIKIELPGMSTALTTIGFSSQAILCIFLIVHLLHVFVPWRLRKSPEFIP